MHKKKIPLLRIFRQLQGITLQETSKNIGTDSNGRKIHLTAISNYEREFYLPSRKTIKKMAEALRIMPDILFYSFGYLAEEEIEIIKSDPFYYMEKIKELCNNHVNRYGKERINLDELNRKRAFDYQENYRRNNDDR